MIQLQLSNLTLVLGATHIFDDLSWEIQHGQKIGLIGANGAGKSSLYKLIVGEYDAEQGGALTRSRGLTVGYLAQTPELDLSQTALESALDGNPRVEEVRDELVRVEASLGDPKIYEDNRRLGRAVDKQQSLLDEYDLLGGDTYPARVEGLLLGLGLPLGDLSKPLSTLSGGRRNWSGWHGCYFCIRICSCSMNQIIILICLAKSILKS